MKQRDHRRISAEVAQRVAPGIDLSRLIAASGEYPDMDNRGAFSHHSLDTCERVVSLVRQARRELHNSGYSLEFQLLLGYALHYIHDLFAICVPAPALHGDTLELHDVIEPKLSRYIDSIAYEAIPAQHLEGEKEVVSFLRAEIKALCDDPQRALEDPNGVLEACFSACVSVSDAVCNNEWGFTQGTRALETVDRLETGMSRIVSRLDEMQAAIEHAARRSHTLLENAEFHGAELIPTKRSLRDKLIALLGGKRRHSSDQLPNPEDQCRVWFDVERRKLGEIRSWEAEGRQFAGDVEEIIAGGYAERREVRLANRSWYGLGRTEYRTADELITLVSGARAALDGAQQRVDACETQLEREWAEVSRRAKPIPDLRRGVDERKVLAEAYSAAEQGDRVGAIRLFWQIVARNGCSERAWLGLSALAEDQDIERSYVGRVVEINPSNEVARRHLERLEQSDESPSSEQTDAT